MSKRQYYCSNKFLKIVKRWLSVASPL